MSVYINIAWNEGSLGTIWGPCMDGSKDPCQCPSCQNANRISAQGLDYSVEYEAAQKRGFDREE